MFRDLPIKQRQILESAEDLFQRFGIKRISIEEICHTATVSKMTFYKYFKNKVELVRFLWERWFEQNNAKFAEVRVMEIPFTEKLALILKLKEEGTQKISYQFALDYLNGVPELEAFFQEQYTNSMNQFMDFIREAQQKGEVRPDMKIEFFLAVIATMKELMQNKSLVELYPHYQDFILEVNNFLFYGLLPRPEQ